MKNTILSAALVILVLLIGYFYITRTPEAPSEDVNAGVTDVLEDTGGEKMIYTITDESVVSYSIGELLNGEPVTVVGETNEVGGEIAYNQSNPSDIQIGAIRINARTFKTDKVNRDNAVVNMVLKSNDDENEFIVFEPTNVELVGSAITIDGDMTVSGVTNPVTFEGTLEADETLKADIKATILYKDFNLTVPDLPFLADVDEEVVLKAVIHTENK